MEPPSPGPITVMANAHTSAHLWVRVLWWTICAVQVAIVAGRFLLPDFTFMIAIWHVVATVALLSVWAYYRGQMVALAKALKVSCSDLATQSAARGRAISDSAGEGEDWLGQGAVREV